MPSSIPSSRSNQPTVTAVVPGTTIAAPTRFPAAPANLATVICPVGFTAYAAEDCDLGTPLFAKVTYRTTPVSTHPNHCAQP